MSCGHCVRSVREELEETESLEVEDVQIGAARISYDPSRNSRQEVEHAIKEAGFAVV